MSSAVDSSWVLEAPPVSADAVLSYGSGPMQRGELRLPSHAPSAAPHPLVVAFHGGFWKARYDLSHLSFACAALAAEGFATFSVEYRRVGQAGSSGTLEDAARATRFASELAERYPVDPSRTVLLGHSAGGQLALWAAGAVRADTRLSGVVALAPVSDLRAGWEAGLGGGAVAAFLGGSPDEVAPAYREASPLERLPLEIPCALLHGTEDDTVPPSQSERYVAHARALGDPARLELLPGAGHYDVIDPRSSAWPEVVAAVRSFL